MRKIVASIIMIFIVFSLNACANKNYASNTVNNFTGISNEENDNLQITTTNSGVNEVKGTESQSSISFTSEGLEFDFSTSSYDYKGPHFFASGIGTCTNENIVIPGKYNNLPVIGIKASAFEECTTLKSVIIEEGIISIGWSAFNTCTGLTEVVIPNSVVRISDTAFLYCVNLTSIVLPNSISEICYGAFANCSNLTTITFNGTVNQWNNIILGEDWNANIPATKVICNDGDVDI